MGVDGIRRAGNKGAVILPRGDVQILGVLRFHHFDLIHLVRQRFIQNMQVETVALFQLVQVGEQHGFGQAAVAGQHAVGAFAAKGVAGAFQMANALLQHIIAGAFVNRQVDVNFRDGDIPQAFAHIHKVHIAGAGILRFACGIALHGAVQLLVIAAGGLLGGVQFFGIHAFYGIIVILDRFAGVALRHRVADNRVRCHPNAGQDHQGRKADF